jgi:hypothetical protein
MAVGATSKHLDRRRAGAHRQRAAAGFSTDWDTAFSWGDHASAGYLADHYDGKPQYALADVTITSIAANEVLKWNGTAWVNNTLAELGVLAV